MGAAIPRPSLVAFVACTPRRRDGQCVLDELAVGAATDACAQRPACDDERMRARSFLAGAIALSTSTTACTSADFATATTDEDTGGASDAIGLDSTNTDSGGDTAPPRDGTVGDAIPPSDGIVTDSIVVDSTPPGCPTGEKFTRDIVPVGVGPSAIAAADLDADGHLDLVVANGGGHTVNVLIGRGDGKFDVRSPQSVGATPTDVVVGDFNDDKFLDIAATALGDNSVGVLMATAPGKFATVMVVPVGAQPMALATGFLNADTRKDLVVANGGANNLYVLTANGSGGGGFGFDTTKVLVGLEPTDVVVTDLNKDTIADFVVVNGGADSLSLVMGGPVGAWTPSTVISGGLSGPRQAVMADFFSTGRLDVAVTNKTGGNVAIFRALGTGGFGTATAYPAPFTEPTSIAATDLDRDGHIDILAGSADLLGLFDVGSLSPSTSKVVAPASALATGDFNGDGKVDVAAVNTAGNAVTILLGCR